MVGASMRAQVACLAISLSWACGAASAVTLDIDKTETDDLQLLYFAPAETYLTPYVGRAFENSMAAQRRNFGWKPWDRTTVLLKDFSDYGNAAARASPNNSLLVDIAPMSQAFETFSAGERFFTLMNHELVHVATMDVWNDDDAWWRNFFHGKPLPMNVHPESILYNYLTVPRSNSPRWYLEGSAVFMETWMAGGFGRAQGAYDEMVFRAMVRHDAKFYDPVGLESEGISVDFQIGVNDYLYGTRFFSYLALVYSPEQVLQWLRRDSDSDRYYSTQFERVFGKPLNAVWADWIAWEHDFQRANLASVQKFPATPTQHLVNRALGSVSRSFYDPRTQSLIGAFRYPGVVAHLGELSLKDGSVRRLTYIKDPMLYRVAAVAYDPVSNKAWYASDNRAYRDLVEVDVATAKTKMLIRDGRIGDLVFNPKDKSLWGIRHLNGLVTLVRIPPPYDNWNQIRTFNYGQILFDPDISPDGELLSVSEGEINGDQTVRIFRISDLMAGKPGEIAKFGLGSSTPEGFVFSPDGRYLFGSSYYTGVSNIYRYELVSGKVECVSNASTGFFRPIPREDGSLIVFEFTGQGFSPVVIDPKPLNDVGAIKFLGTEVANKHPIVKTWAVGSPSKVPLDSMITARGKYVPWKEMRLDSTYPIIEGYKGHGALGWHVIVDDPMLLDTFTATLSYSPSESLHPKERWHVDLDYHTVDWHLRYWHNYGDFYDLFGPIQRARKGDAFIVGYHNPLIYDPPRTLDLDAEAAYYIGLDTLPGAQTVHTSLDQNIFSAKLGLKFSDTDKSLGAVDHEQGYRWNILAQEDYANDQSFPKIHAGFDFGFALPWKHSSIWLYTAVGAVSGDRANPLAFFYIGSFKNNYVDDGEVKRYREYDSFPGFDIDELNARTFGKTILEWNLPPVRFSDVGTASFYLSSVRPAVFAGAMITGPGREFERTVETAGIQLDWNFTVALRLPMVFSVGYAVGIEDGHIKRNELMASLKIL